MLPAIELQMLDSLGDTLADRVIRQHEVNGAPEPMIQVAASSPGGPLIKFAEEARGELPLCKQLHTDTAQCNPSLRILYAHHLMLNIHVRRINNKDLVAF